MHAVINTDDGIRVVDADEPLERARQRVRGLLHRPSIAHGPASTRTLPSDTCPSGTWHKCYDRGRSRTGDRQRRAAGLPARATYVGTYGPSQVPFPGGHVSGIDLPA